MSENKKLYNLRLEISGNSDRIKILPDTMKIKSDKEFEINILAEITPHQAGQSLKTTKTE